MGLGWQGVYLPLLPSSQLLVLYLGAEPFASCSLSPGAEAGGTEPQPAVLVLSWDALRSPGGEQHPLQAEVRIQAEGQELILDLEKNGDLFAPGYTETHYSQTGQARTIPLAHTEHCFYQGVVRGRKHSSVTLSSCQGLRGLIVLRSNCSYVLEPLPDNPDLHHIYRLDDLRMPAGACGHQDSMATARNWLGDFAAGVKFPNHRVRREALQPMKYVELLLVADYAEVQKHHFNIEATRLKLVEAANYVDKFYRSLNIRIALVGLEIWSNGNKCDCTENPYSTLKSFLAWSSKERVYRKHDNAQLITGVPFQGTTVGLAPVMSMCSDFQSGGVNMDHSDNAIGVAATIAHEMGHNFGMNHDSSGCCTTRAEEGGCIMASATGHPFPRVFNQCNRRELEKYLHSGGGMCLSNMPDTKRMYGGRKCGNGYLEEGEECDCGEVEECNNPCCNANNCSLKLGAQCAHGSCCHECKLMSPGTLCREKSGLCDLPEYCTGQSPFCPSNSYQIDGTSCEGGKAYCYNGMCLTYKDQCLQLWGPGAWPAPDTCFEKVNAAGDVYGNCGKDVYGNYRKCEKRDAKCGKIQCQSSASKPVLPNAVPIDTTISLQRTKVRCRGTHVYRSENEEKEMLDPALVLTGTKCGSHHVCFEGRCQNTSIIFESESCSEKCNGNGVCNNNKNCHCNPGWAPPFCNKRGDGGSLDSGPPSPEGSSAVVIALAILASILLLIGVMLLFYYLKCWNKFVICSLKKAPQISDASGNGHANPAFKLRTPQQQRKVIGFPEIPSKPPPQPAPCLQINMQQQSAFTSYSYGTGSPAGPVHPALAKDVPRRTPPSRPAPPAPRSPPSQDISRPRPPQRALPANPVPSRCRARPGDSPAIPLPPARPRIPGQLQPVAENTGARTARAANMLRRGHPGSSARP
ncbi:disintegrin and metalloproteinase domain-containing protein 19 isoform X1 [Tympanuchus pallidicinctus]|uniref:disintegrin and metalloproteinase domain-containing protein 19 isoform X1 n=1 Tax=Tympanuchus pallidicinctus TaxID=109042 RepID=UPI0022871BAD|nr:disintegrin and metalloproteinase domain-containing protein 19 isoform X1 [Tympanuchus pallidicinctus]